MNKNAMQFVRDSVAKDRESWKYFRSRPDILGSAVDLFQPGSATSEEWKKAFIRGTLEGIDWHTTNRGVVPKSMELSELRWYVPDNGQYEGPWIDFDHARQSIEFFHFASAPMKYLDDGALLILDATGAPGNMIIFPRGMPAPRDHVFYETIDEYQKGQEELASILGEA